MAVPTAAVMPFLVAGFVLYKTGELDGGAYGLIFMGLIGVAATVGTLIAPSEIVKEPRRWSPRRDRDPR